MKVALQIIWSRRALSYFTLLVRSIHNIMLYIEEVLFIVLLYLSNYDLISSNAEMIFDLKSKWEYN